MNDGAWVDYPMEVVWEGGQRFRGGRPDSPTIVLDGEREAGPGPVDGVIIAFASCSAIDVVDFLSKRRTPARHLDVRVKFARAAQAPRRLTAVHLLFHVVTDSAAHHVARAVELSIQKYCSVAHSLQPDIDLQWEVEVETGETPAE